MKQTLLWLDDYRDPTKDNWLVFSPITGSYDVIWITNYNDFVKWVLNNGLPTAICFDHDLADEHYKIGMPSSYTEFDYSLCKEKTGYDAALWLISYCMDKSLKLPLYASQSANPVGRENILKLLYNFNKHTND